MNKNSIKHLPSIFEKAASDTWKRLKASSELGVSQNETTITDIILLDLKIAQCPFLHILKTPQHLEHLQGTDWEWWIGANNVGWLRYAVQAKKIDLSSQRYDELGHTINGKSQLEILQSYSYKNNALGRYCFYNYVKSIKPSKHWHCNLPVDLTKLGCSIATLSTVVKAKNTRGYRNFNCIHSEVSTLPFRCLVACPMILSVYAGANRFPTGFEDYAEAQLFESLPRNIQQSIETGYFQEWDSNFYSNEIPYRPARILVAELPYWSNQR
ncbi:MAG: DUF6615 family protein [Nostoc sp.]|uniref:DUF6615 family protein n=1 Tax=Nostoc sp. TaxID=1180 RepID=UPI002FF99B1A